MLPVYKSKFSIVDYDPEDKLIIQTWTENSDMLCDESFLKELSALTEALYGRKIDKLLVDQRKFFYIVPDAVQEKIDKEINLELYKKGIRKVAFVVSPDIFSKFSVLQTFDKDNSSKINARFFEDYDKAVKWLNE